jgi:pimeloyl-ACP methyl ester carboxylesterase
VNGLEIYYEIHGTGQPLVVLHGAYMTSKTLGEIVPSLAETRQVIALELQGHGHTTAITTVPDLLGRMFNNVHNEGTTVEQR